MECAGFAVLSGNLFDSALMKKSGISGHFATNTLNLLAEPAEIARRKEGLKIEPPHHATPWQELYRKTAGQLGEGACMELDNDYVRIIERWGTPRNSH